jgi:hypothetical protein
MTQPEAIKVGQLKINYLIDGTASGGMGVFELTVLALPLESVSHSRAHELACLG